MQTSQPYLIARDDTLLGVCQAIGDDLGFNPVWLRTAFAVLLLWNPAVVVGAYAAAGVVVLFSRLIAPDPRRSAVEAPAEAAAPAGDNDGAEAEPLAAAA